MTQEILNTIDNNEYLIRVKFIQNNSIYRFSGIDDKFLVRQVAIQSDVENLDSNAVVYGLYQIQKPDTNRLMSMKNGILNCVVKRIIEHFNHAKRDHGLTNIWQQKIDT
ncbi:hypothetical protein Glove_326g93 [Diversispora epigaea]|uniref:Uncharacterized protein n=1 Tax=Diversispora epigaea TaxID=1348612 RepID=A0A397HQE9_9GLOM|nr:hypothetical protein Glove_326g93 [Diversispora epigaea]